MSESATHPTWALAYISRDWQRRGSKMLRKAYDLACDVEQGDGDCAAALAALNDIAHRFAVYSAALTEVGANSRLDRPSVAPAGEPKTGVVRSQK